MRKQVEEESPGTQGFAEILDGLRTFTVMGMGSEAI